MASRFTHFPKLITELRLEIWWLALPAPLDKLLYPYKKGWVLEDLGSEPSIDANGEDLYLRFDTNFLDPHRIRLPLYSVNREARGVALKYVREQGLLAPSQCNGPSGFDFLRPYDPRADLMFVPTGMVQEFARELPGRLLEPDLLNRHVGIPLSNPALPRIAVTLSGLQILVDGGLELLLDYGATIGILYVVDVAAELEDTNAYIFRMLGDPFYARLFWSSSRREWEVSGDDEALMKVSKLVSGLGDSAFTTSKFDLDIQLVTLTSVEAH